MKRKLIYAALLITCVVGLSACGKSEAEQAADYYENELGMNKEDAEELADYIHGDKEDAKKPAGETGNAGEIEVSSEILSAERYCDKVQIGNKVYEFPLNVSELLESGELTISGTSMEPNTNESTLVPAGETKGFFLVGNGVKVKLSAYNDSDSMSELKNCTLQKQGFPYSESSNIIYSGGLRVGMTYDELIALYGEPDHTSKLGQTGEQVYSYYEDVYYDYDYDVTSTKMRMPDYRSLTGYGYNVRINMDTGRVSFISLSMGEKRRGMDFVEYIESGDGCNMQFYAPEDILTYGRLYEADGKKYKIFCTHGLKKNNMYDGTAESLLITNMLESIVETATNDDGSVFVMSTKETGEEYCCIGYYYANGYCLNVAMNVGSAIEGDRSIQEAAKQEVNKIVKEIFDKGVTIK